MEESITLVLNAFSVENGYRFQVDEDNFVSNDDENENDKASP